MIKLIQKVTANSSSPQRNQAQKQILQLRQQNPQQLFQQLIQIFINKQIAQQIRQVSGTVIFVSILAKKKTGQLIWDTLNPIFRNNIKTSNLSVLIDQKRSVRRTAANIVSAICYIELPRNQWDGIVQKICQNINHHDLIVKQASILTLGFICTRMKQKSDFSFPQQVQNNILSGIILGIQQRQPHLVSVSIQAFKDCLSSLTSTLQIEQYRTFVLKELVAIIQNEKYRVDGLQILAKFVRTCYLHLANYIQGFIGLLNPYITNSQDQQSCIAAMQVWQNMAGQYKQRSEAHKNIQNFITGDYGRQIVTQLLKNLIIVQSNQSYQYPISDTASKTLQTIFQNGSTQYKALVLQFVALSIHQSNWKYKQASVKAFSILIYGLNDNDRQLLISSQIGNLIGLLQNNSKQVQFAVLDSLTILAQISGKFIIKSQNFVNYLKLILNIAQTSQRFLLLACKIIDSLCSADKQQKLNKFSPISDQLISYFLKFIIDTNSSIPVVGWTTNTVMNVIEVTNNEVVAAKYLNYILQNLDNIDLVENVEKRNCLQSSFFTIMQFCLFGVKKNIDQAILGTIYTKVINSFKKNNDVSSDGFYVIHALVPFFQGNQIILNNFWAYIIHALTKWQDPQMFRATITCISSFLSCFKEQIGYEKLQSFVPKLIELLQNPNFSKQLKLDCLVILGQVFLICRNIALAYLQKFLQVIIFCCSASIKMIEIDFSYSQQLKDNIVQSLMCIIHGLNTDNQVNKTIAPYINSFFQFIKITTDKKNRPTVNYLKRSILLMSDLAKFYPQQVRPYKRQSFVGQCINTLKTFNKNQQYKGVIKYAQTFFK